MTVAELIDKLRTLDPSSKVWVVHQSEVSGHGGSVGYTHLGEPMILADVNHVALTNGGRERTGYVEQPWVDIAEGRPPKIHFDNVPREGNGAVTDVPGLGYWVAEGK